MDRRVFLKALAVGAGTSFLPWSALAKETVPLKAYLRTNWSQDPYSYGSYSYIKKGARQRDRRVIEKPINNRIFFAGEALHPKYNSSVHAAYESGLRAAERLTEAGVKTLAVIGAGISGLAAAHRLSGPGIAVTIFEARDRIGGRIWTNRALGAAVDLGATWIHGPKGNPIKKLADDLGIRTVQTEDSYHFQGRGRAIPEREVPDWMSEVLEVQLTAGADQDQLNLRHYAMDALFRGTNYGYPGPDIKFPNGYHQIFKGLEGDYQTKLSTEVTGISQTQSGVALSLKGKETAAFDAVLVTVPLGVLKKGTIAFNPPLPDKKQASIDRLGMGTLDKLYLLFDEPFWDKDASWIGTPDNGLEPGQFNVWLNLYRYLDVPILLAFNGGTPALELAKLSDKELISRALQTLKLAYPT